MQATIDNQSDLIQWARERIGYPFREDAKAIGFVEEDGTIRCVVVYDCFSLCDVCMHIASDGSRKWLRKMTFLEAFDYPFMQLGMRRVTGLVPAKNKAALNFDLRIGFEIEGKCRKALPDDDVYILGMLRENCPYIPQETDNV